MLLQYNNKYKNSLELFEDKLKNDESFFQNTIIYLKKDKDPKKDLCRVFIYNIKSDYSTELETDVSYDYYKNYIIKNFNNSFIISNVLIYIDYREGYKNHLSFIHKPFLKNILHNSLSNVLSSNTTQKTDEIYLKFFDDSDYKFRIEGDVLKNVFTDEEIKNLHVSALISDIRKLKAEIEMKKDEISEIREEIKSLEGKYRRKIRKLTDSEKLLLELDEEN